VINCEAVCFDFDSLCSNFCSTLGF
jgi:hypothetical protein